MYYVYMLNAFFCNLHMPSGLLCCYRIGLKTFILARQLCEQN